MTRLLTVSQAQDQVLEAALDLERLIQRLHRCSQTIGLASGTVHLHDEGEGPGVPPSIELALADEIRVAAQALSGVADGLRHASRLTEASLCEEWCRERRA